MVEDHSDNEKGNPLLTHGLLFLISSKGSFICITPTDRITHTTAVCYTSRGTLAGTRNSSMGLPRWIDPTTHRAISDHSYHIATSRSAYPYSYRNSLQVSHSL